MRNFIHEFVTVLVCDYDISTIFWKSHDISKTTYRQTICRGLSPTPKKVIFPKLAQNNVGFFLLPSTTMYQCVLPWKLFPKKLKNENLNWHWSCPKERADPRRSKSAKKLFFNHVFKILLIMLDLKTQLVTSASCPGANFELSWSNVKIFVQKLQPFYGDIIFSLKISKNRKIDFS